MNEAANASQRSGETTADGGQESSPERGSGEEEIEDEVMETAKEQEERMKHDESGSGDSIPTTEGPPTPKVIGDQGGKGQFSFITIERKGGQSEEENSTEALDKGIRPRPEISRDQGYLRKISSSRTPMSNGAAGEQTPKAGSPIPVEGLPWRPKVREVSNLYSNSSLNWLIGAMI